MFLLEWARIFCSNIGTAVIKKPLLRNLKFVIPFAFDIQHWVAHLKSPGIHHLLDAFTTALSTTLLQINKNKFRRCLVVFRQAGRKDLFIENKEQGPTTSSKRVTMVEKISCDTCVIAELKMEFEKALLSF